MLLITLRSLLSRKFRLLLTSIAVVLGVAFVSGAFVLTDSLSGRFDKLFESVNSNINVQVRGVKISDDVSSDLGEDRTTLPMTMQSQITALPEVKSASGGVTGQAVVVGRDGKAVGGFGPPAIGDSWDASNTFNPLEVVQGAPPTNASQVLMTVFTANQADVTVGDTVRIVTKTGTTEYTVSGLAKYFGDRDSLAGETYVAFTLPEAQRAFDIPNALTYIDVHSNPGVTNDQLKAAVQQVVGDTAEVMTNQELNDQQQSDIRQGLGFFNTFLLVFAAVALFVGAFIIANTFSILIAQRTKELALLRAMGASRGQITRSVLVEALAIGLLSSILGLFAGVGLSYGLQGLFSLLGAPFPGGETVIAIRTVIVSLIVGVGVTCAAALFPARRAAKIPPVAAMRDAATPDRPLRRQVIIGAVLGVIGAVLMTLGLTGSPLIVLGIGVLLVFLGVALLSPALSRPAVAIIGAPFRRGIPGRLGKDNAARNPRRTAATAAALMIGLALVGAIGVLGSSAKASIAGLVKGTNEDFIVQSTVQTGPASGVPDDVVAALRNTPGVRTVSAVAFDQARLGGPDGPQTGVNAADDHAINSVLSLEASSGDVSTVPPDGVLVGQSYAKEHDLAVGDQITLVYVKGNSADLRVTGIYKDNQLAGDLTTNSAQRANFFNDKYQVAFIDKEPGASASTVRAAIDATLQPYPTIDVQDQSEFIAQQNSQIDQVMRIFQGLLVLAIVIAAIGIVNTLALSVLERTRELGMLRAIGMSRKQMKRMVRVEAVVIAVFGAVLGIVVGVGFGVALQSALDGQGINKLALPWGQLAIYVILSAVIGVLAAVIPARRAARMNVLNAIKAE